MATTSSSVLGAGFTAALIAILSGCAENEYRIPYIDGTRVEVTNDFLTHATPDAYMFDMRAVDAPGIVAAAAPGWVRYIEDGHSANSTTKAIPNNYVWIEHPGFYCQDPGDLKRSSGPGKAPERRRHCIPCDEEYCNEWTVYAHFVQGSVTDSPPLGAGLKVGDWVEAGDPIGIEGDVGFASSDHLHFFVAVIDPEVEPDEYGYYLDWLASMPANAPEPERIPLVCHDGGPGTLLYADNVYDAEPCP